jgi:diguanylate cyclase (GGDEF)-like protein
MTTQSLSFYNRIRLTLGIVAWLTLALAAYLLLSDTAERQADARALHTAQDLAARIEDRIDFYRASLLNLSRQDEVRNLLEPERARLRPAEEEALKDQLPYAQRFHIVSPEDRVSASTAYPFLDAPCVALLRRSNGTDGRAELHWPGTSSPHLDLVQPVLGENGGRRGVLYLSLDIAVLSDLLAQGTAGGYVELQPGHFNANARNRLIWGPEKLRVSKPTALVPVANAPLELALWADPAKAVSDARGLWLLLVALSGVLWLGGALIVDRIAIRTVYADMRTVASMLRDLRSNVRQAEYPIRLLEFRKLSRYVTKSGGKLARERRKLKDLGLTDHGSGLPNRRAFEMKLEQQFVQTRMGIATSVLLVDIDRFKQVNDSLGHDAGDILIRRFARALRAAVRESDIVARLGGDEFCVIFPHTELDVAYDLAERIRAGLPRKLDLGEGRNCKLSWTGGLSTMFRDDSKADQVLWRADKALLKAKAAGRNRTWIFEVNLPSMLA